MKILITGSEGYLGRNISLELKKKYTIYEPKRAQLDFTDSKKVENYFKISFIGIFSTSIFSVSYQLDSGGPYMFSAGSLIFLGIICNIFIDEISKKDRILFFSLLIIGLFIGLGYIFQGIILSFLVYYITINQSDLFSVLLEEQEQNIDDDINI